MSNSGRAYNVGWEEGTVSQKLLASWLLLIALTVFAGGLLIVGVGATRAQTETERYYNETGHSVRGPFLAFFDSHGGLAIFGYPVTEEFVKNGLLVQYFQRVRFEWHPDNPAGFQVQLSLLGDQLGYAGRVPAAPAGGPTCQFFPETQHSVCGAFLTFFRQKGGIDVFGYPIGEWDKSRDRLVQPFQRARMEWYPEKPDGQKVQLTDLGLQAFDYFKESRNRLGPAAPYSVTQVKLRASVKLPVTGLSGAQTVYAVVTDQQNKAITGAFVTVVVHLPNNDRTISLPPTDERGRAAANFTFEMARIGETVTLDASVTYENLTTTTRTSFLPWR